MNDKSNSIDRIPEEFATYEEGAEFWDTHDTTDYLDDFETVACEVKLQGRRYEIEIDEDLVKVLHHQAVEQGVDVSQIVNKVLRESLENAA